jgi:hypothetical protein
LAQVRFKDFINKLLHVLVMGTSPVDLPTAGTPVKILIIFLGLKLQTIQDFILADGFQPSVAVHTALEGADGLEKVIALEDFAELLAGTGAPQAVAARDRTAF